MPVAVHYRRGCCRPLAFARSQRKSSVGRANSSKSEPLLRRSRSVVDPPHPIPRRYLERACALAQMAEDVPNEAAAASNLGVLLGLEGDTVRARQLLERAVQLRYAQRARSTTEGEVQEAQRALAGTLTNLAGLVQVTENARAAMSFYKLVCTTAHYIPAYYMPTQAVASSRVRTLSHASRPCVHLTCVLILGSRFRYCDSPLTQGRSGAKRETCIDTCDCNRTHPSA